MPICKNVRKRSMTPSIRSRAHSGGDVVEVLALWRGDLGEQPKISS